MELHVDAIVPEGRLAANGLMVVNPPFTLQADMATLLPKLVRQLGTGHGSCRVESLNHATDAISVD